MSLIYNFFFVIAIICFIQYSFATKVYAQASNAPIPRYEIAIAEQMLSASNIGAQSIMPYIIKDEDVFQGYIQQDAIAVWVNVPSLQQQGDTLTAVVKRVVRQNITHELTNHAIFVDVMKYNIVNDTFAGVLSLDTKTGQMMAKKNIAWEKTTDDLDANALYHYIGFLYQEKQKKNRKH